MTKKYVCAVCVGDGEPCVLTGMIVVPPKDCPFESYGFDPDERPNWVEVKE